MTDSLPSVEIQCPRCGQPHAAQILDRIDETEWIVACGAARAVLLAPVTGAAAAAPDILVAVRRELAHRLALPADPAVAAGTGPAPLVAAADAAAIEPQPIDSLAWLASVDESRPPRPAPWLLVTRTDGRRQSKTFPPGLLSVVLALNLPSGAEVLIDGDCWVFRYPDGDEVRLCEPFDDPGTLRTAIEAGRKRR